MLYPPPLIVQLGVVAWTTYVTPAATWPVGAMPVEIALGTSPPPSISATDAQDELDVASRAWGLPPCSAARFSIGAAFVMTGDGADDGVNEVIVHTTDWPTELEPGAVAHTVLYLAGTQIVEADVHVNAKDWTFAVGDVLGDLDLRSVLTHELGHVLGIGHSTDPRATMSAGLPPGIAARSLEDDDVAAVCALYPRSPPAYVGCDRGDPTCPAGYACVGHDCERPDEPGTLGGPCSTSTFAGGCDGAGDRATCIATSIGAKCALPCPTDPADDCGATLACVDGECLPIGATPTEDAGVSPADATSDAPEADDATAPSQAAGSSGCTCGVPRIDDRGTGAFWALAIGFGALRRRARSRR